MTTVIQRLFTGIIKGKIFSYFETQYLLSKRETL